MSLTFDLKGYLRGFLLLAIATAVFSLVNLALSAVPDTLVVGGGDLAQLCGVNATSTATPAPAPTPSVSVSNITLYDPFDALDTQYWVSLTHPWIVDSGWLRTSVTELNYDNAVYYAVDLVESGHDAVSITTSVLLRNPSTGESHRYCVFLSTVDLSTRVLGCIETYGGSTSVDVYLRARYYVSGSVRVLGSRLFEVGGSTHPPRMLRLSVTRVNSTHVMVVAEVENRGSWISLSPVIVAVNWNGLGYFGFHMTRYLSTHREGFDYVSVQITSPNATSTVSYNYNYPPPLPATTTTVTVTAEFRDILVMPLGSFIRVLSFMVYVVYIVRTVKHFVPEF